MVARAPSRSEHSPPRKRNFLVRHLLHEWPAILFIAAIVAIVDHHLAWVRALDTYAFTRLAAVLQLQPPSVRQGNNRVAVVGIDDHALEQRFHDRSPLDRCALVADLSDVYDAAHDYNDRHVALGSAPPIRTIVIDLDLSPSTWLAAGRVASAGHVPDAVGERACARELYALILRGESTKRALEKGPKQTDANPCVDCTKKRDDVADGWKDQLPDDRTPVMPSATRIATVLMQAFPLTTDGGKQAQLVWGRMMSDHCAVSFGNPRLAVEYGVLTNYAIDPQTLPAVALRSFDAKKQDCATRVEATSATIADEDSAEVPESPMERIDPRHYANGLVWHTLDAARCSDADCRTKALAKALDDDSPDHPIRAVFYGATFGEMDRYLTPLGLQYGVAVHAATLLSALEPLNELGPFGDLATDIAFGWVFSLCIAWVWKKYFDARTSEAAAVRATSGAWLAGLSVLVLVLLFLLALLSAYLLYRFGLWGSPLPVAIGIVIDSLATASSTEAVHAMDRRAGRPPHEFGTFVESAVHSWKECFVHFHDRHLGAVAWHLAKFLTWLSAVGFAWHYAWKHTAPLGQLVVCLSVVGFAFYVIREHQWRSH